MTHRPFALVLAVGTGLAVMAGLTGERRALGQPNSEARAAAAALFEDGRRLMGEGKFAEACPKLAESQRVDPGMGTLYQLSVCYEAIGHTASAWVGFRDVAGQALTSGLADREKAARGKAAALEQKLMRLKISMVPGNAGAGVEVKRDGAVVSPALWGTPLPLDPGPHKVSATGPGKEPWEITVQLEQPGGTVNVEVPQLLEKKAGAPGPGPTVVVPVPGPTGPLDGAAVPLPLPPEEGGSRRPWQLPLGIAATVVGAGGLATGVAFGFMAKSTFDQSNSTGGCSAQTSKCTSTVGLNERTDAVNKGNTGTGIFVAGAVVAAGGIVLWITAPSSHKATVGGVSLPQIGLGPNGVSLRGSF
jgi:hypothetical protein